MVAHSVKNLEQCRNSFDSWVGKMPFSRKWQPTPVFLPGKSYDQRRLAGYSPRQCKIVGHDLATKPPPVREVSSKKSTEHPEGQIRIPLTDEWMLYRRVVSQKTVLGSELWLSQCILWRQLKIELFQEHFEFSHIFLFPSLNVGYLCPLSSYRMEHSLK